MGDLTENGMNEIEYIHGRLFGDDSPFSDEMRRCIVGLSKSSMLLKNQCSDGYSELMKWHEKPDQSKKHHQKKRRQKKSKKSLTFEKSKRIFGVFSLLTLTNIKRTFFSLNRVPKSRIKGTKIQGVEANFGINLKKEGAIVSTLQANIEAKTRVWVDRFIDLKKQKGTKIQDLRLNEAKNRQKGTKKSGEGTKIQDLRLSERAFGWGVWQ